MRPSCKNRGFNLVEMMITMAIIGVVGLIIFSLLNVNSVLGAKNTAMNTAHQEARVAMLQMIQDVHTAISLPFLADTSGNQVASDPAPGIGFQQWACGPYQINKDVKKDEDVLELLIPNGQPVPQVNQRLIIPMFQIEDKITAVNPQGNSGKCKVTLAHDIGDSDQDGDVDSFDRQVWTSSGKLIRGTDTYHIVCFITDRCSYTIANNSLVWTKGAQTKSIVNDITNSQGVLYDASKPGPPAHPENVPPTPFSIPSNPDNAAFSSFVSALDLSTSDRNYTNRGFKAANIFLNGQVPIKARLTTYQ
jgi:prepilin-type N-terminal cleavage/methylation domain-containing protein